MLSTNQTILALINGNVDLFFVATSGKTHLIYQPMLRQQNLKAFSYFLLLLHLSTIIYGLSTLKQHFSMVLFLMVLNNMLVLPLVFPKNIFLTKYLN